MDFRTEATVLAAKALVEAQLVMLVIEAGNDDDVQYVENRRVVLLAADKAWKRCCHMWAAAEGAEKLEVAIMLGFRQAVEERQNLDVSDADGVSNRVVRQFVESFNPSSLIWKG